MRVKWSQNFLTDKNLARRCVRALELDGNQPKGWLCSCEGTSDGEVNVVCMN
jgi:hypothetical protein